VIERATRLHSGLLFTILLICAALLIWALAGLRRREPLAQRLLAGLWIAELLVLAECAVGALLWIAGLRPARPEPHLMYGLVAALTIPVALGMAAGRTPRASRSLVAVACLFLAAIALRALLTGRG
jgi:hypothetical protein